MESSSWGRGRHEDDLSREAELVDQGGHVRSTSASPWGPLGPPTMTSRASGWSAAQRGQGAHGHRHPLERLDPADEQQQRPVLGQGQRPSGLAPVAGTEEGVVDAGGHDADPGRVGAVQLGDLGRLDRARASTVSEHRMMAASASARRWGASASTSSGLASALTRSRVWKVDTSGRFSWCLIRWPAMPLSQ